MNPIFASALLAFALISSLHCGARAAEGDPYAWPAYTPSLNYNSNVRLKTFPMPTQDMEDCKGVVGTQNSDWWTFKWGKNKRSVVTSAAITPMLARFNKDFAYFRDTMRWAPDSRIQAGYRSAIYLFGSGLCTDTKDSNELGGWQSSVGKHPIVLASYYPVYSFDPGCPYKDRQSQMGAMIHEGIHSLLASLPSAKQSAWIQEAGNTWLQQQAEAQRTGDYSTMGFLNAPAIIAPFMPIECYSGWLQDGSFGGPSAEGVNEADASGKQICTWRRLLGGTQYGNLFPVFLGEWLGRGSVPWIWNYCPGRVLQGMADSLGDAQMRLLIVEYRARLALLDLKNWSEAAKKLVNDNFGSSIGSEWAPYKINVAPWIATPYAKTTDSSGSLIPEARTTPGWSGANLIPLKVTGSSVSVTFRPLGANMSLQLCYRATDGTSVYSAPVATGNATLRLDKAPANGVVIAVVCNTDYKYLGEATRKAHFDFRLQPGNGITGAADVNKKWYDVKLTNTPGDRQNPIEVRKNQVQSSGRIATDFELRMENGTIRVHFNLAKSGPIQLSLYTASGSLISHLYTGERKAGVHQEKIDLSKVALPEATFLVTLKSGAYLETRSMTLAR
ncbi:MAG: hypothetical protein ABIW76_22760 [Fibrobacteria bacterium]